MTAFLNYFLQGQESSQPGTGDNGTTRLPLGLHILWVVKRQTKKKEKLRCDDEFALQNSRPRA